MCILFYSPLPGEVLYRKFGNEQSSLQFGHAAVLHYQGDAKCRDHDQQHERAQPEPFHDAASNSTWTCFRRPIGPRHATTILGGNKGEYDLHPATANRPSNRRLVGTRFRPDSSPDIRQQKHFVPCFLIRLGEVQTLFQIRG
jgi:hypothetical protein